MGLLRVSSADRHLCVGDTLGYQRSSHKQYAISNTP